MCSGVEFCDRKRVVIRENSEHAITALNKVGWQAGTKGNVLILENAPKQWTDSRGAIEVASRLMEGRIARHASQVLNWCRGKIDGSYRASRGRTYGGEVVTRKDQVSGEVLGRTQRKFEECRRPGGLRSEEVGREPHRGCRQSTRCQIHTAQTSGVPEEVAEGRRTGWHPVGDDPETGSLLWKQDDSCAAGGREDEIRTHVGG